VEARFGGRLQKNELRNEPWLIGYKVALSFKRCRRNWDR